MVLLLNEDIIQCQCSVNNRRPINNRRLTRSLRAVPTSLAISSVIYGLRFFMLHRRARIGVKCTTVLQNSGLRSAQIRLRK